MISNCPQCKKFIDDKCTVLNSLQILNGACNKYSPDDISYLQHRMYRGILLPAITEGMGETNDNFTHELILKPEFIYRATGEYFFKVNCFDEIPAKHQKSARFIMSHTRAQSQNSIIGYVPSMGKFTKTETKEYFKFCEKVLEEIGASIADKDNQEYESLKERLL